MPSQARAWATRIRSRSALPRERRRKGRGCSRPRFAPRAHGYVQQRRTGGGEEWCRAPYGRGDVHCVPVLRAVPGGPLSGPGLYPGGIGPAAREGRTPSLVRNRGGCCDVRGDPSAPGWPFAAATSRLLQPMGLAGSSRHTANRAVARLEARGVAQCPWCVIRRRGATRVRLGPVAEIVRGLASCGEPVCLHLRDRPHERRRWLTLPSCHV